MNTMKLPGFTAESGLSTSCQCYKEIDNSQGEFNSQIILPQLRIICVRGAGGWSCGVEDDRLGMSYSI